MKLIFHCELPIMAVYQLGGASLESFLSLKGSLPLLELKELHTALLAMLSALRDARLVHLDLKPSRLCPKMPKST